VLITNDHAGPGVVPGRYPGAAIPIRSGPTPQWVADQGERAQADGLAGRICAAAAEAARSQYVLLELLGEFDAWMRFGIGRGSSRWRIGCLGVVR
jgi:hypothetical protein